jgi:hypothetical protein
VSDHLRHPACGQTFTGKPWTRAVPTVQQSPSSIQVVIGKGVELKRRVVGKWGGILAADRDLRQGECSSLKLRVYQLECNVDVAYQNSYFIHLNMLSFPEDSNMQGAYRPGKNHGQPKVGLPFSAMCILPVFHDPVWTGCTGSGNIRRIGDIRSQGKWSEA